MNSVWNACHFIYNGYSCICNALYVELLICLCIPFMFGVLILSSTGALRGLEECHKVAIQEAIDQECWGTADSLLDQASSGKP